MKENTCYDKLINGVNKNGTIVFYGKKNPTRAFLRDVDLFAAALKKRGFEKGDVLSVYLPTSLQAIVAFYACSKIGVTANIVHPLMPLAALKENMRGYGVRFPGRNGCAVLRSRRHRRAAFHRKIAKRNKVCADLYEQSAVFEFPQ